MKLPPLCEREDDIPFLAEHSISQFNRLQDRHVAGVSSEVMAILAILIQHDYPGNVRELEDINEHAFVLCRGGLIERQHVPPTLYDRLGFESPQSPCGLALHALETMHIRQAIRRHDGNRKAAAERLGIHPSTLLRKIKALGPRRTAAAADNRIGHYCSVRIQQAISRQRRTNSQSRREEPGLA